VEAWLHAFLATALDEGEWSASRPGRFAPGGPGTHWIGVWVVSGAGLDAVVRIISGTCWEQNPGRRARSPVSLLTRCQFCKVSSVTDSSASRSHLSRLSRDSWALQRGKGEGKLQAP